MGNTWLRNAAGEQIIGADGFPLVNNTLLTGDPTPDFTLKMSHRLNWKTDSPSLLTANGRKAEIYGTVPVPCWIIMEDQKHQANSGTLPIIFFPV